MIAVLNQSPRINARDLARMVAACGAQQLHHLGPLWGLVPQPVVVVHTEHEAPPDAWLAVILRNSDQANALGYHGLTPAGRPYARVFEEPVLSSGGSVLRGANSVSAVLSHECCEAAVDPYINMWFVGPDGTYYAAEVCDPVEQDAYDVTGLDTQVSVSNFILPNWASPVPASGRFDYMGTLREQFAMTQGGYEIIDRGKGPMQVLGAHVLAWRRVVNEHPASRTYKRLRRRDVP